jgi:hypothetical protein
MASKSKQNETLQQKPIETTKIHHGFHHIEQSMKCNFNHQIFHLQRITQTTIPKKHHEFTQFPASRKTQTNTSPSQHLFHKQSEFMDGPKKHTCNQMALKM